jgi:hypothetical protein
MTTLDNASLTDDSRFEVLGLVSVALPGPWWWQAEDINDPGAVGAIFRCYEQGNEKEIGYLLVVDVSQDPDEADVSTYEDSRIPEVDRFLESGIRSLMTRDGRKMTRWMSSHLNHGLFGKAIVTAYIAQDKGLDRQYIDVRIRAQRRNVIIAGCFDVNRADQLAKSIFHAISTAKPLDNQPS